MILEPNEIVFKGISAKDRFSRDRTDVPNIESDSQFCEKSINNDGNEPLF